MKAILEFVALVFGLGVAVFGVLYYADRFDLIIKHESLSGSLIGASMTIVAAFLAWTSVQAQLSTQRRSVQIAETTFWQQQANESSVAISGLTFTKQITDACKAAFRVVAGAGDHPYSVGLLKLQATGALDQSSFPPTGTNLISWDLNYQLAILRIQYFKIRPPAEGAARVEAEPIIKAAIDRIIEMADRIDPSIKQQEKILQRAQEALAQLDLQAGR